MEDFARIKAELSSALKDRADALGWRGKNGKLTKRGQDEALSWLVGAHVGMSVVGKDGLGPLVWVASVRGVDAVLDI